MPTRLVIGCGLGALAVVAVVLAVVLAGGGGASSPAAGGSSGLQAPTSAVSNAAQGGTQTETVVHTVTARPPVPSGPYQVYRDATYGFRFVLPSGYRPIPSVGPQDVAAFRSANGKITVRVQSFPRAPGLSSVQREARVKAAFVNAGGRPTYTFHARRQFIVSGYTASGGVYYQFGYLGTAGEGGFIFTYPRSARPAGEPAITHAYDTFRRGSL